MKNKVLSQRGISSKIKKKQSKNKTIELNKFFAKVDFKIDGLEYQRAIRREDE